MHYSENLCRKNITKNITSNLDEVTCLKCISKEEKKSNKIPSWYKDKLEDDHWSQCVNHLGLTHLPKKPKNLNFEINEEVIFGAHKKAVIMDIFDEGQYYKVKTQSGIFALEWDRIDKLSTKLETPLFKENKIWISYSNSQLHSLISKVMYFGVDMNPSYQRDYVWELEDKIALIDSIFNRREIGRFIFVSLPYTNDNSSEILDGKQRLQAIIDFYTGKIQYKGKYYYELHPSDRRQFEGASVVYGNLAINTTLADKLYIFKQINITGKVMSKEHLNKIDVMIEDIKGDIK